MRTLASILILLMAVIPAFAGDKADKRKAERERKERADDLEKARKDRKKRGKANRKENEALGEKLGEVLQEHADRGFSGTVLVVKDGEKIVEAAHGFADTYKERHNATNTLYDTGSLTKQFTATAALRLEDQGKLSMDDELRKYWDDLPADKEKLTLHQLATHTSGCTRTYDFGDVTGADRDEVVYQLLKAPLVSEPGEKYEYSNTNYFVLAAVIDKVADDGFDEYMKTEIFKTAGLKDTAPTNDKSLDRKRATGRYENGQQRGTSVDYGYSWGHRGATGIVSTVNDLWLWTLALEEEEVLSFDAKQKLWKPEHSDYAYGWQVLKSPTETKKIHHSGAAYGARSWYAWYPEDDVMIALFLNDATDPQLHFTVARDLEATIFSD